MDTNTESSKSSQDSARRPLKRARLSMKGISGNGNGTNRDKVERLKALNLRFTSIQQQLLASDPRNECAFTNDTTNELMQLYEKGIEGTITKAGELLHRLCWEQQNDSDNASSAGDDIQKEDDGIPFKIRNLVRACPEALAIEDSSGDLPIQTVQFCMSEIKTKLIPFFANEAIQNNIFPHNERGGLLTQNKRIGCKPLEMLCGAIDVDDHNLETIKVLIDLGLFQKPDLRSFAGIFCGPDNGARFEFLTDWCPESLKMRSPVDTTTSSGTRPLRGNLPIHEAFHNMQKFDEGKFPAECQETMGDMLDEEFFRMYLKATVKHYPQHFGFLFRRDENDLSTFSLSIARHGLEKTFSIIRSIIPSTDTLTILHKVLKHEPTYWNAFLQSYPDLVFVRNESGRLLLHTALFHGMSLSSDLLLMTNTPENAVTECDPVTGLAPFMLAASERNGNLTTVYYLLRRRPESFTGLFIGDPAA